jgi:hypothetical protein
VGKLLRESGNADDTYEIPTLIVPQWASDEQVIQNIASGNIVLSLNDEDIQNVNKAIDILKDNLTQQVKNISQAFSDKVLINGKKIFTRIMGIEASVGSSSENIDYVIPFNEVKITGIEIINSDIGDKVSLQVLDTPTGTLSGVPNMLLNEFGTSVNLSKDFYKYSSCYDADLIKDMKIRLVYDAVDSLLPKTIYINFYLHEIK